MKFIVRTIVTAFAILLVANLLPSVTVTGIYSALIGAFVLGILNAIVRPILVILTLPITVVTLGLFIFVINASLFLFASSLVHGFEVTNFWGALLGSLIVSIISSIVNKID